MAESSAYHDSTRNSSPYTPDSAVLLLVIDSFHKTQDGESPEYDPSHSLHAALISDPMKSLLVHNRQAIYSHLKKNDILWPGCDTEIQKINPHVKSGKDVFGDDATAQYLPAISRYTGDLYEGLGDDRRTTVEGSPHHLLILSALYGLVAPYEPVQNYACQFGDKNLTYDIWTRDHGISRILAEYVNTNRISRIFDFTYCSVPAYHEAINWDYVREATGADVLHVYHEYAQGDQALKSFGGYIRDHMLNASDADLLGIRPGTVRQNLIFKNTIRLSENETLRRMIDRGENDLVEFKTSALWSMYLTEAQIAESNSNEVKKYQKYVSRFIIARSIAGFLNASGGNLILGVKEDKVNSNTTISGVSNEFPKLREGDRNPDGYRLMIIDMIAKKFIPDIIPHFSSLISISFHEIEGQIVCWLQIRPSPAPVFVEAGNEELFFVRVDASTRPLAGKALVEYCLGRYH
jgi:hypothetical protein